MTDGAAMLVLASGDVVREYNLQPLGRIVQEPPSGRIGRGDGPQRRGIEGRDARDRGRRLALEAGRLRSAARNHRSALQPRLVFPSLLRLP